MEEATPALWNRNFVQCCISYFLMNFAFYMLMPTLPLYLVDTLGAGNADVGLVLSAYTTGVLCVRPFSGYLVDCFSRKPLYLFAFFFFSLFFCGYLFASALSLLMVIRFLQGGFMGLTSVAGNTIAIDVIPSSRRGEGMGFYGLTINLAMSLAPLFAVSVYPVHGFDAIVWISMLASFAGFASVGLIRCPKRDKIERPPFSLDRFILLDALPSAFSYICVAIPYGMIVSFAILYGKELQVADPGYFFLFMAVGVGCSRLVSGRMVDRGRLHSVAIASIVLLVVVFAIYASVRTSLAFYLSALFIGIGYGTGVPAFQCLFVNVAPNQMRGTATSTYLTSFDVGVGIGSLSAGFISSAYGLSAAYWVGAFCCLLSLVIYLKLTKPAYAKHCLL
ncbi:MAG TPA: MFS transporter [Parabacteroides sp.]|nr:MFS transporter [Parabacteroides sp.]